MEPTGNERGDGVDVGFGAGIPDLPARRGGRAAPHAGAARAAAEDDEGGRAARSRRGAGAGVEVVRDLLARGPLPDAPGPLADLAAAVERAFDATGDGAGLPPLPSTDRILAAAEVAAASDPAFATAPLVAIRPHWSEPVASWTGRAVAALERGARVLFVTSRTLEPLVERVAEELSVELGPDACLGVLDPQYDLVRRIAGIAGVELDLIVPDAFATTLVRALEQAREAAAPDDSPAAEALRARVRGAFGAGVVDADRAALRIRRATGRSVAYAVGPEEARRADVSIDRSTSPADAAREVARLAFGPEAIGGYATEAVARAFVGAREFSEFTAELLEAVDGGVPGLGPPGWTRAGRHGADPGSARRERRLPPITSRLDAAANAARRIGLDEGATLIHDDRTPGAHALVFTNVEPRMSLGASLRGPATLALLRVRG